MIITETVIINGKEFIKTYSNEGRMIERDGVRYGEAIDPVGLNRTYIETDEYIDGEIDGEKFLELVKEVL